MCCVCACVCVHFSKSNREYLKILDNNLSGYCAKFAPKLWKIINIEKHINTEKAKNIE